MMNICKIRQLLMRIQQERLAYTLRRSAFSTEIEEKIEIPTRIPRGPTDILRALESTVGRDPTAAHYKYHDDPYLIPMSSNGKRAFAMAQEAGRKAAHWVRQEHADLFQHKEAEPLIKAFVPPIIYNENSEVSLRDLETLITTAQVSDSIQVYKLLKKNNSEIPPNIEQSFLELLCYQNCEDGLSEEFIEERWFRQSYKAKEKIRKTWKDGDFAEEVFSNLKDKSAAAYCTIIQGMIKYQQVNRAWELFEEAQQKNLVLNTNTFNSLISVVNFIKEDFNMRWTLATNLLLQMKSYNLKPNLATLNAFLQSISNMGHLGQTKENMLKVLSEFKHLGIEPSLTSWHSVLLTFCKDRGPVSTILYDILDTLEGKELKIQDLKDINFFVTAMEVSRHHLKDVNVAKRVDELLHYGNNYNLIGDSYKESVYYRHYFALLCENLPIEEFMNTVYYKLVPHIYVPEPAILGLVLGQVDANGAVEYIPRLWSDLIIFDHSYRENLVEIVLNTIVNNEQLVNLEMKQKFASISWDIFIRSENQNENKNKNLNLTGDLLGKVLMMLLRNKEFEKACTVMDKLEKNQHSIVGVPKLEALSLFVDNCIEEKAPSRAIACIQYCSDCGFPEASLLASRLTENLTLDEIFLGRLSKIVGDLSLVKMRESS